MDGPSTVRLQARLQPLTYKGVPKIIQVCTGQCDGRLPHTWNGRYYVCTHCGTIAGQVYYIPHAAEEPAKPKRPGRVPVTRRAS